MEIIPVKYAESLLPESMIFENGDQNKLRPIVFKIYLIKSENRNILVDAGCETMPGFDMKNFSGPIKALEKIKVLPDDITDVILTHAHHDHAACAGYFKNAVIHIEKDEYRDAAKYIPADFKVNVFCDEFTLCENLRIIKIGGHSKGSCVAEIKKDGAVFIIAGDECYLRECLDKKIPTGCSFCPEKSKEFIEKYGSGSYNVLLCHDE